MASRVAPKNDAVELHTDSGYGTDPSQSSPKDRAAHVPLIESSASESLIDVAKPVVRRINYNRKDKFESPCERLSKITKRDTEDLKVNMPTRLPIRLLPETLQRAGFKTGAHRAKGLVDEPFASQEEVNAVDTKKHSAIEFTVKKKSATVDSLGRTRASKRKPFDELEQQQAPKRRRSAARKGKAKS